MKIPAVPIFKFLRILSVVCFGVFGMIHVASLIAPDFLAPYNSGIGTGLLSTFALLMVSFSFVHYANPRISEMRSKRPFTYQFSGDYYKETFGPLWTFMPFWAKLIALGLLIYSLIFFFALRQSNYDPDLAEYIVFQLRTTTVSAIFFYWLSIWLWHAEIRKREKSQTDDTLEPLY